MRQHIRVACVVTVVILVGYGLLQPIKQDARWIGSLWLAAPLMLIAMRLSLPNQPRSAQRSIQNLGMIAALAFVLLSLQLLRQQFVRAGDIADVTHTDSVTGATTSNVRHVIHSLRIKRGKISDRNGVVLVDTQIVEDGFMVRTYPLTAQFDPTAFSGLVGFFSDRFGQSGLEATYNGYLSGENDTYGQIKNSFLGTTQVGDDLRLTIDARLQDAARRILGDRTGSIVVLDPKTGAVLAMVSTPGFDPSQLAYNPAADRQVENTRISEYWKQINSEGAGQPLLNRPTQGRYPPGSTFKTLTAVGVLQHPREGQPDKITCPNDLPVEEGAPPVVNAVDNLAQFTGNPSNLERVYAYSCNTAFAQYALRLGDDRLADIVEQFDIFRPREAPEIYEGFTDLQTLPSLLYVDPGFLNRPIALADTGFGQGQLLMTPLQMAMVAATIANDGVMMRPYLVDRITRPDGSIVIAQSPYRIRRAISSKIAATMRGNMRAVVSYGFGKAAGAVEGVQVGGKSGTAEHGPGTIPHAWFIAIAPVEQSRYAVAVMIENGMDGAGVGAAVAGQVLAAAFALE